MARPDRPGRVAAEDGVHGGTTGVAHGCGLVLLDWLVLHDPVLPSELVLSYLEWLPIPL